ncbi:MAG: GNAT family N-acetyltransferase [Bacteroidota bacterium]
MKIHTRKATVNDLPAIHQLVRELAIYEKAEEEFIATIEEYVEDFNNQVFQSIVAEIDGKVAGMVLFYLTYSTWKGKMMYLEDFVVSEQHRQKGIGQILFDAFLEASKKQGCKLVKWQVLDWNQPAINFYLKNGAVIEKEWWNGKILFNINN